MRPGRRCSPRTRLGLVGLLMKYGTGTATSRPTGAGAATTRLRKLLSVVSIAERTRSSGGTAGVAGAGAAAGGSSAVSSRRRARHDQVSCVRVECVAAIGEQPAAEHLRDAAVAHGPWIDHGLCAVVPPQETPPPFVRLDLAQRPVDESIDGDGGRRRGRAVDEHDSQAAAPFVHHVRTLLRGHVAQRLRIAFQRGSQPAACIGDDRCSAVRGIEVVEGVRPITAGHRAHEQVQRRPATGMPGDDHAPDLQRALRRSDRRLERRQGRVDESLQPFAVGDGREREAVGVRDARRERATVRHQSQCRSGHTRRLEVEAAGVGLVAQPHRVVRLVAVEVDDHVERATEPARHPGPAQDAVRPGQVVGETARGMGGQQRQMDRRLTGVGTRCGR